MMRSVVFAALCTSLVVLPAGAATKPATETTTAATVLPPADRAWTADDYEAAAKAFGDTAPSKLPSLSGPNASPVFLRMVDRDNLKGLTDTSVPLMTRVTVCERLMLTGTKILMTYLPAVLQDPMRSDDLLWVEGLLVQETGVMIALIDEARASKELADADQAELKQSLDKITTGLEKIMDGSIKTLRASPRRPGDARGHLAAILAAEYPKFIAYIPAEARTRIETDLGQLAREDSDAAVRAAMSAYADKR